MNDCPAETGFDAHHQHQVDQREDIAQHLDRSRRLDRHPGLRTGLADHFDAPAGVVRGFVMEGHDVGARLGETRYVTLRARRSSGARRGTLRSPCGWPSAPETRRRYWGRTRRPSRRYVPTRPHCGRPSACRVPGGRNRPKASKVLRFCSWFEYYLRQI